MIKTLMYVEIGVLLTACGVSAFSFRVFALPAWLLFMATRNWILLLASADKRAYDAVLNASMPVWALLCFAAIVEALYLLWRNFDREMRTGWICAYGIGFVAMAVSFKLDAYILTVFGCVLMLLASRETRYWRDLNARVRLHPGILSLYLTTAAIGNILSAWRMWVPSGYFHVLGTIAASCAWIWLFWRRK